MLYVLIKFKVIIVLIINFTINTAQHSKNYSRVFIANFKDLFSWWEYIYYRNSSSERRNVYEISKVLGAVFIGGDAFFVVCFNVY